MHAAICLGAETRSINAKQSHTILEYAYLFCLSVSVCLSTCLSLYHCVCRAGNALRHDDLRRATFASLDFGAAAEALKVGRMGQKP